MWYVEGYFFTGIFAIWMGFIQFDFRDGSLVNKKHLVRKKSFSKRLFFLCLRTVKLGFKSDRAGVWYEKKKNTLQKDQRVVVSLLASVLWTVGNVLHRKCLIAG